jgi:XrtN system VIT domain protein
LPIYGIGIVASFVIGISLHTFIPLIFCIILAIIALRAYAEKELYAISFVVGMVLPILFAINFATKWSQTSKEIQQAYNRNELNESTEVPNWIYACQKMSHNWISERVFKSNLVYVEGWGSNTNWFGLPNSSFDAARLHDPLVTIARWTSPEVSISDQDCIQILRTGYDARHQAQEKLWNGDNLSTANVSTYTRIYPDFRMAYTEKTIKIHYKKAERWENPQEALYTFHLPEGGVVSSLSLWIAGVEQKGYLTSKAKADSAYKTIVGVESRVVARDPSVVHWQEGNTVTVRVFPCTSEEDRQFKIGVTAPLLKNGEKLTYQSIYFQGHSTENTTENIKIQFTKDVTALELPFSTDNAELNNYYYEGNFKPYWEVHFATQKLATEGFSFQNKTYQVQEYHKKYQPFVADKIYVDLNNAWSKTEFETVLALAKNTEIYAYNNKLVQITTQNKEAIFEQTQKLNFSLFPIYLIQNPATALLITKAEMPSPNIKDLENSIFAEQLKKYLNKNKNSNAGQIRLYNIGENLSPYLKTLKELRTFVYDFGNIESLETVIKNKQFVENQEDSNTVVLNNAEIKLQETTTNNTRASTAPDHLLRLYAYNNIMRQIAANYFSNNYIEDNLLKEASTAYIVSPLSSLVVLETQKDYDRFGIKASENSLQNASMKASGAVPEPHEWLLIISVLVVFAYLIWKK